MSPQIGRVSPGARRAVLALAAALFLAGVIVPVLRVGGNVEELAGLLDRDPQREYVDIRQGGTTDGASWQLRESRWMPVFTIVAPGDHQLPLMVDAHIGAVAFWPHRPLLAAGGLIGARALSVALGLALLAALFALTRRLRDERTALLAVLLTATLPTFVFLHAWVHPEETWTFLAPILAALCLLRRSDGAGVRWTLLAALLLGFAVASKNTAVWTVLALGAAAFLLDRIPRLSLLGWVASAALFLLPLVPQLVFAALAPEGASIERRNSTISGPWDLLDPERLRFFANHFLESFGGLGSYMGDFLDGGTGPRWDAIPGAGVLYAAGTLGVGVASARRGTPGLIRFAGLAIALLIAQYVAFYYVGMTIFGLVTPFVPLATALAAAWAWDAAAHRRPLRWAVGAAVALLLVNNVSQTARYAVASMHTDYTIFDRPAQEALARDLDAAGVNEPWTTTYGIVGVLELLTDDRVSPRHGFPVFVETLERGGTYEDAWSTLFDRMAPGTHHIIVTPRPSELDVNPLQEGSRIAGSLPEIARKRGISLRLVKEYPLQSGATGFQWMELSIPEGGAGA